MMSYERVWLGLFDFALNPSQLKVISIPRAKIPIAFIQTPCMLCRITSQVVPKKGFCNSHG